ncbi:MAG: hypothetical protein NC302_02640 [Bacteroidales bacterium]|nr:hypothetical protein [Bacteroidales bacterium]MCM1417034.1 hypothetical protein [bacterium]MCM1423095.1 hypothetical protein [bacterium]
MRVQIRRFLIRAWLTQKRLLTHGSFLLLLVLPLLFSVGLNRLSQEESGLATIALYLPEEDLLAEQVGERLFGRESAFRFLSCADEEEAVMLVEAGEADAAWIFSGGTEERLRELAGKRRVRPLVKVVERRDSVPLILAREVLSAAVYPAFSYAVYESYVTRELGLTELEEETLRRTYEDVAVAGSLFQRVYPDGTTEKTAGDTDYVLAPLRGILAIWLTFLGIAAALLFIQDEERGVYGRLPAGRRSLAFYGTGAVFLLDGTVVLFLCSQFGGAFTDWKREAVCAAVFACCVLAFSNFLRLLCRKPHRLGVILLPLGAAMFALCPVFVNLQNFRAVKLLLPPRYYLLSIHNTCYLYEMAVYTVILIFVGAVLQRLTQSTSI